MSAKTEVVLMKKHGEVIAIDPAMYEAHVLQGWYLFGMGVIDGDGNVEQTGKVIETPAHVLETSDHVLKTIPDFSQKPAEVILPAAIIEEGTAAKPVAKAKKTAAQKPVGSETHPTEGK
jgi:hypothetical protein